MKPFFITTAIDYTNGEPHIGHAYEKVLADVLIRFYRQWGRDGFFLTGVDQHGQKVQQSAEKLSLPPRMYVNDITAKFRALWKKLGVQYDAWAETTDILHQQCVRTNLQMLWDDKAPNTDRSRWIYKKVQRGFYSVRQEQFLTDKERDPDGKFGEEWQPVEEREEENFYFRLTFHPDLGFDPKEWLLEFIDRRTHAGNPFVVPEFRLEELKNALNKLEGDLCISRPIQRLQWGIPFPETFGQGFVTYVWFDALMNYITFAPNHHPEYREQPPHSLTPNSSFSNHWPPLHLIGKDILIPAHGIYWPIMLKALGFTDEEMPTLLVHGWWNIRNKTGEREKMSKSRGNVVNPDFLTDKYGTAAMRYYLMSDIATGKDADFSEERIVQRYNADLANGLGNLLNRTLKMIHQFQGGKVHGTILHPDLIDHLRQNSTSLRNYREAFENAQVHVAMLHLNDVVNRANVLIDFTTPWKIAKDPLQKNYLNEIFATLIFSSQLASAMLSPVAPDATSEILRQLNLPPLSLETASCHTLPENYCCEEPHPIFPRIEFPQREDS